MHLLNHYKKIEKAPGELVTAIGLMDQEARKLHREDWRSISCETLWNQIHKEEKNNHMFRYNHVLDLGSGNGAAALIFSYLGYSVTGIEITPELSQLAEKNIKTYSKLLKGKVELITGSYYPPGYKPSAEDNEQIEGMERYYMSEYYTRSTEECSDTDHIMHKEASGPDPTQSLRTADIYYAFAWNFQAPSIIDLYKKYSKSDAKLLLISPSDETIARTMGLKTHNHSRICTKR